MNEEEVVLYMYGLVTPSADVSDLAGVEDGAPVFLVSADDVACAATYVPAREYQEHTASDSSDRMEWVSRRAWRHHLVLQALHARGTVVPLKFGTLCTGVQDARALLRRLRDPMQALLEQFAGRDEWALHVRLDEPTLADALRATDPELLALKQLVRQLPGGRGYFAAKKLERATAARVAAQVKHIERLVRERLLAHGIPSLAEPLDGGRRTAAALAALVDRHGFGEMEAALRELEAEHDEWCLTFELVGPWPPYSFAAPLVIDAATTRCARA